MSGLYLSKELFRCAQIAQLRLNIQRIKLQSIKIVDFVAPEFEIFTAHMLLDIRFKVALDFIYHTADSKKNNCDQQVSISKESFGTCRYISEQQWFKFEFERVVF